MLVPIGAGFCLGPGRSQRPPTYDYRSTACTRRLADPTDGPSRQGRCSYAAASPDVVVQASGLERFSVQLDGLPVRPAGLRTRGQKSHCPVRAPNENQENRRRWQEPQ